MSTTPTAEEREEETKPTPGAEEFEEEGGLRFKACRINGEAYVELFEGSRCLALVSKSVSNRKEDWAALYKHACAEAERLNSLMVSRSLYEEKAAMKRKAVIEELRAKLKEIQDYEGCFRGCQCGCVSSLNWMAEETIALLQKLEERE